MNRLKMKILITAAVLSIAFYSVSCGKKIELVGKPAPEFSVVAFDGIAWDNKKLAGKPYILYFFASW